MFAMIEKTHRYTSLLHGAYAGYVGYRPCIVTKVTRDGIVKEARLAHGSIVTKRDWDYITVDSAGRITNPESVVKALVNESGLAIEYHDRDEAVTAIKSAAGIRS